MITRRSVVQAGGIGLLVAPWLSHGQPRSKTPRIGVLWFLTGGHRAQVIAFAASTRLPASYDNANMVRDGGLASYGPLFVEHYVMAAGYVDKILKGAKPAELPVEQPKRFELIINLKPAKALGLTIPQSLLVRADEVIQ